jgi:hypothetical protein
MTIKERIEQIQKLTDSLQWDVNSLDENYRYHNLIILDMSTDPFSIHLLSRDPKRENAEITCIQVCLVDLFYCNKNIADMDRELDYLQKSNAPQAQIDELNKIRELLGL